MPRILAIDFGLKRTGLAVTDNLQMIASPLRTVPTSQLKQFLSDYLAQEQVEKVLIGLPYRADGTLPDFARHITELAQWIEQQYPQIKIEYIDERYTSKLAVKALVQAGVKRSKRRKKETIDQMAAAIMLQEYLGNL